MMRSTTLALLAWSACQAGLVQAQQSGWQTGQVNATMCYWSQLRAAVIKDTVYMDGGFLYWIPGMQTGEYGAPTQDGNPLGLVYTLNFSTPFNVTSDSNISTVLSTISKAPNGGLANNFAPNYFDGAMLANDDEWFLYGGLLAKTDAYSPPNGNDVITYQAYQYGAQKDGFRPGFVLDRLPDGVTRYVTYGGAANAPSENKAYYFSGMRSPTWGEIYTPSINDSINAVNVSDTLITLDLATQQQETWKNSTLPPNIKGRANPELVWVPVGSQGILVALGGVVYPEFVSPSHKSSNEAGSAAESPVFMSTIDVYDVASGVWYQQPTIGGPGALTRGCAVVAPASDMSSFNIYYYGGYDGVHIKDSFSDDVWILSLPSFMWMKVSSGTATHGRAGHKCVMPYPDQMMVIGGYVPLPGAGSPSCLKGNIVQMFNLSSAKWMDGYDPAKWSQYAVPEMIYAMIGGNATGGATMTTPTPTGWATPALGSVFATAYPTGKLAHYYPYGSAALGNNSRPGINPGGDSGGGTPSWIAPVVGVIVGLFVITLAVLAFMLWRKRKVLRHGGASEGGHTDDNGVRILNWIRGQPSDAKAPTVTTDDPISPSDLESRIPNHTPIHGSVSGMGTGSVVAHPEIPEMMDSAVHELPDTSPRAELQDTGLTPVDIINKHTHFGTGSLNTSLYSSIAQTDHASTISGPGTTAGSSSIATGGGLRPLPEASMRPDSPSLGMGFTPATPPPPPVAYAGGAGRVTSGVSGISDTDRSHLRQISETSVSSLGTDIHPRPGMREVSGGPGVSSATGSAAAGGSSAISGPSSVGGGGGGGGGNGLLGQPIIDDGMVTSPISMPSSSARDGSDYITAGGSANPQAAVSPGTILQSPSQSGSPLRRSVFYENEEDLGGRR